MKLTVPLSRLLLCAAACAAAMHSRAQDPQLSQFYAAPMYLNPALTGNTDQDRIALNYRLQWPGIGAGYKTYAAAFDHRSTELSSGLGGMVMHDRSGSLGLSFTQLAFNYSYEARLNRHRAVRGGLRAAYTSRTFNWGDVLFADQVIRESATSIEPALMQSISYFDFSAGFLYYTGQFWAGASLNHLNQPQQSFCLEGDDRLPMRASAHAGYRFAVDGRPFRHSETTMTLAAHYKAQQQWDQLDVGGYVDHKELTLGMWYRGLPGVKAYRPGYSNDDAVILMLGYETPYRLRMVYSYDITVSKLTLKSGGAHELSVIYEWARRGKNRKYRSVPCPKF
ncbi:MAG: type IX secretion system membrane protein PorP/SprF [Flavobacteriales bacterium]|nr:type IX secretion system membrane protein PorP/SprF [Flavobacteriales bacterium]